MTFFSLDTALIHPIDAMIISSLAPGIRERAAAVKLMIFDVDGVLTDGSLYYGENGEAFKRFNTLDGYGLRLLSKSGIQIAWMTGRSSAIVSHRAADLGITEVLQGVHDKAAALTDLARRLNFSFEQIGYMGDDMIDLPAMQKVIFAACVPNAPAYISRAAHWISNLTGGCGAVRECCDLILAAQSRLGNLLSNPNLSHSLSLQ